jgi:hypothetical protein
MGSHELKKLCENWDSSSEGFIIIINAALNKDASYQLELIRLFEVPVSTISRWANGVARPHPIIQKKIVNYISQF